MPARPASSEEVQCWSQAAELLKNLSGIYANSKTVDTMHRVNRLISTWPTDDTVPAEGLGNLQSVQGKLTSGLTEIMNSANQEVKAIEDAMEQVGVLIALRKASESSPPTEKRNKRPRAPSPSGTPIPVPSSIANSRSVSITLPPRTNSVGPTFHSRESRAKKDTSFKQLQPGRKVVYHHQPKPSDGADSAWILAVVVKYLGPGKYEVQDAEPQDDGKPGPIYKTTLKSILPLPDPDAQAGSLAHLDGYPVFSVGSNVMALYPDTSCFYRAEVIAKPDPGNTSSKYAPAYKVKFEDDEGMEHSVSAFWVVEFP